VKIAYDFVDDLRDNDIEGFKLIYPEDETDTDVQMNRSKRHRRNESD